MCGSGIEYGGAGRVWHYGEPLPADVAWIGPIVEPVFHFELTEAEAGDGSRWRLRWKKFGDIEAPRAFAMLLPAVRALKDSPNCTLLIPPITTDDEGPAGDEASCPPWREIRVYRSLRCVHVFIIDALGRFACTRQCYASDERFAFASELGDAAESRAVPRPLSVQFRSGTFLVAGSKGTHWALGGNVLVTDKIRQRRLIPVAYLQGQLPGALLEQFRFWQRLDDGACLESEHADTQSDPFFAYVLNVRLPSKSHPNTTVERTPPGSAGARRRRLVGLLALPPNNEGLRVVVEVSVCTCVGKRFTERSNVSPNDADARSRCDALTHARVVCGGTARFRGANGRMRPGDHRAAEATSALPARAITTPRLRGTPAAKPRQRWTVCRRRASRFSRTHAIDWS